MLLSQQNDYSFKTFADYLNELQLSNYVQVHDELAFQPDEEKTNAAVDVVFLLLRNLFNDKNVASGKWWVVLVYRLWALIEFIFSLDNTTVYAPVCKSLELLFKCSERVRFIGGELHFLLQIIDQIEATESKMGTNPPEFIRKHGNTKVIIGLNH